MRTIKQLTVAAAVITTISGAAFIAQADNPTENDALGSNSVPVSLNEAVDTALATVPGKAANVDFSNDEGRDIWEIEIIDPDNQVHDVEINARTGAIIKNEIDTADHENDYENNDEDNDSEDDNEED